MKKHIKTKLLLLLAIIIMPMVSCSDDVLNEIDTSPNSPIEVPLKVLLPPVQVYLTYAVVGGDMSLYAAIWNQFTTGVHAQCWSADRLIFTNELVDNTWNSLYWNVLRNCEVMIQQGTAEERWSYVGIAQILKAYGYGIATDTWGRVPYSEALQGAAIGQPAFDTQESIYTGENGILALLDQAIVNLQKGDIPPSTDDLFYGGDVTQWTKAAYALKAKHLLRLKNTSHYDATAVLNATSNAFESAADSWIFTSFGTGAKEAHPWFQESEDRIHMAVSESMFNMMAAKADPRCAIFFDGGCGATPAPNGVAEQDQGGALYSKIYNYITADSPLEFITYDQVKFMEAEAHLSNSSQGDAITAFEEGVRAALARVGIAQVDIDAYADAVTASAITLKDIAEERYVSLYPYQSIEAYAEWRRTDFPNLSNPNGTIPMRFPYGQTEIDANPNTPNIPLSGPGVWWDDGTED